MPISIGFRRVEKKKSEIVENVADVAKKFGKILFSGVFPTVFHRHMGCGKSDTQTILSKHSLICPVFQNEP